MFTHVFGTLLHVEEATFVSCNHSGPLMLESLLFVLDAVWRVGSSQTRIKGGVMLPLSTEECMAERFDVIQPSSFST